MPRAALIAAALCLACAVENDWTDVESLYRVEAGAVVCDGAVSVTPEPPEAPTSITCAWERVQYEGEPRCYVIALFERSTPESPWATVAVFPSSASCD